MSSIIDEVQMEPAFESDNIRHGSFYFACLNVQRKTSPESYWIVLRPPREWLPTGFFDTRPVQERVFPFWILGRAQRIWLPRSSIFNLHRSQRHIFPTRKTRHEFDAFFDLIESFKKNVDAALKHFEKEVLDATALYNQRRQKIEETVHAVRRRRSSSLLMDPAINDVRDAVGSEQRDTGGDAHGVEPQSKRRRLDDTERPGQPIDREASFPAGEPSHALVPRHGSTNPRVKTEPERRYQSLASAIKDDSRVRIYVGATSEECSADITVLQQSSPVLFSLICSSDAAEGKYIMHPRLRTIVTDDFLAVLEFMQTGEYSPALVSDTDANDSRPMRLDGLTTTDDYSDFLVQAGRLYLLAKMFQVRGMVELIIRKVTRGQFQRYSNIALIELARIVLSRPVVEKKRLFNNLTNAVAFDPFDQWIVGRLAGNLMEIMRSEIEHSRYLVMVHATSKRQVHAEVLERAAALYRQIGGLPEVIDDD